MINVCFAITCLLMIQGCTPILAVQPKEMSTNVSFDGDWSAVMIDTMPEQRASKLTLDCAHFSESFFVRVSGGIASGYLEADENYSFRTYVDESGNFTALIPTATQYQYARKLSTPGSEIVLILRGTLGTDQPTGQFVIADPALRYEGCTTRVKYISL